MHMNKKIGLLLIILALLIGMGTYALIRLNQRIDTINTETTTPPQTSQQINFVETGTLTRNNPGQPQGEWFLIYEQPGAPALNVQLNITQNSQCFNSTQLPCTQANLQPGDRVLIRGVRENNTVEVTRLEVITTEQPQTNTVVVFFSQQGEQDCTKVIPVKRNVEETPRIGEAAIEQLLLGTTAEEQEQGLITNIPENTQLQNLTIEDGTATVDFNTTLNTAAGSCRVQAIRAQITQTLQQFPTVEEVIITVNGSEEEVLQP